MNGFLDTTELYLTYYKKGLKSHYHHVGVSDIR